MGVLDSSICVGVFLRYRQSCAAMDAAIHSSIGSSISDQMGFGENIYLSLRTPWEHFPGTYSLFQMRIPG